MNRTEQSYFTKLCLNFGKKLISSCDGVIYCVFILKNIMMQGHLKVHIVHILKVINTFSIRKEEYMLQKNNLVSSFRRPSEK